MQIQLDSISKSFDTNTVLRSVSLTARAGEIVALVGENGAGKSTLTRIISGVYSPSGGTILVDGEPVVFHRPQDAMRHGIQVIYQEFKQNLFPHLTIAENIYVADLAGAFGRTVVDKRKMNEAATRILDQIGLDARSERLVETLSISDMQMVAIGKALSQDVTMLILDEPTAALDGREAEKLFEQVRGLRDRGVCVVYITHRLSEIFSLADRVVVLRDGQVTLDTPISATDERAVVGAMVGRTVDDLYPPKDVVPGRVVLGLGHLTSGSKFRDVSLTLRAGEVLGVGGTQGCGKDTLLRAIFGLAPITRGTITLAGAVVQARNPADAIASGLAYVTPDRQREGLCLQQSVRATLTLASLSRLTSGGFVSGAKEMRTVRALMQRLRVRASGPDVTAGTLSGGNQQKVLFGRWIDTNPTVLLLEEPTRGVDVGARSEIYLIIHELARQGMAILLVSSDLPELVGLSRRVLVMRSGEVVTELTEGAITQRAILDHALEQAA